MDIFKWEDFYATGVAQIDEHHQHLVGLLNKVYHDFLNHAASSELSMLFNELIDYATYHFHAEEQLMQVKRYPQLAFHQREHEEFTRRVMEMHVDYNQKKNIYFLEILGFLNNWLMHHILQLDAELGRFLAAPSDRADTGREHGNP